MGEENRPTAPGDAGMAPQSVWLHDDEVIQHLGDTIPESHWSRQNTQPNSPHWPAHIQRRMAARRAAVVAGRESRALGLGAGLGVLLTLAALALALLLAFANGWLPGGSSTTSESGPWPIPVQTLPHTPIQSTPGATSIPTVTTAPTTTEPAATAEPTATSAPTATPTPTPRPAPTATTTP